MPPGPDRLATTTEQETIHLHQRARDGVELVTGFEIGDSYGASSEGFDYCH